jgi:hypothetical protein
MMRLRRGVAPDSLERRKQVATSSLRRVFPVQLRAEASYTHGGHDAPFTRSRVLPLLDVHGPTTALVVTR